MTQAGTHPAIPASRTPPRGLMRFAVNPLVRLVLRSPAGRWTGPVLLLEVRGRRSGRRLRIPVVGHSCRGELYAITDGRWAANFEGGRPLTVVSRGRRRRCVGSLVDDPSAAAAVIRDVVARSGEKALQVSLPPDVSDGQLAGLRRVIRLTSEPVREERVGEL